MERTTGVAALATDAIVLQNRLIAAGPTPVADIVRFDSWIKPLVRLIKDVLHERCVKVLAPG